MLRNYFKVALRNLLKNKVYSAINLAGLTLGLTVVMLIALYVKDDLSFDRFHRNGPQIYRLVQDRKDASGNLTKSGNTGYPQGPAFVSELGEFRAFCRLRNGWNTIVKKGNEGIKQDLMYADASVFTLFSFETLGGNPQTALNDLKSVVITDRTASMFFGDTDPVGKLLQIGDGGGAFNAYTVAAVVKHPPANSSIQFDMLLSFEHMISPDPDQRIRQNIWFNTSLNTFLLVNPNADIAQLEAKMVKVTNKYTADYIEQVRKEGSGQQLDEITYRLQPFYRMHLDPEYFATNGIKYWSDGKYPAVLSGLALLVLLIACINFVNLALARSLKRAGEIGIRKVAGGTRQQLLVQFLSESFLLTLLAFLPALLLAHLLLPLFSQLTNKYLESTYLTQPATLGLFVGLLAVVALLAGFYPAVVLSGFQPIDSLKGKFTLAGRNTLGKALVVFQFVIAGVLLIGTLIFSQQFDYIMHANLGYKTDNTIRFWLPWEQISTISAPLKHELAQLPHVTHVSGKSGDWNSTTYEVNGTQTDYVYHEDIDDNHLQLMGIPLIKGRYFSSRFALDTVSSIIVNEAFVRQYVPEGQNPFTTPIRQQDSQFFIVGIVKDFHYNSFKEQIKPMVWQKDRRAQAGCLHVRIAAGHYEETIAGIRKIYKKYVPYLPLEYFSLEEFRMKKYGDDLRLQQISTYTAIVAILIACLGLFGLATLMTEQRTKEIGIRKVLGASVVSITTLLSKDFLKLVLIAIVIASPIAWYAMNQWLNDFAYRIDIEWWVFALAGLLAVSIALVTISFQAIKAALMNPVKSLRSE